MSIGLERAQRITERSIKFVGGIDHDEVINEDDPLIQLGIESDLIGNLQDVIANSQLFGVPSEGDFEIDRDTLDINEDSTFAKVRGLVQANTVHT
jgi:hypothetical protein